MHVLWETTSPGDLPPFSAMRVLTQWELDPFFVVLTTWVVGFYLIGVWVLHRRGDHWPVLRTFSFVVLGMGTLVIAVCSGLGAYDTTLLSVHMEQHMLLSMAVPIFLALGAPVTLMLRTLPRAPRGWLLAVLHSRFARVLSFAPLTFFLYISAPWMLYFTGWYPLSVRNLFVHEMTHFHLVLVGSLFFWPLLGVDPVPGRVSHPFRVLLAVLTLPFHAFLGVTIMGEKHLIAGDWYRSLDLSWLPDPAADQKLAGGLLWASGDVVGLILFAVLFVQWLRSAMREGAREDRRLDLLEARERAAAEVQTSE